MYAPNHACGERGSWRKSPPPMNDWTVWAAERLISVASSQVVGQRTCSFLSSHLSCVFACAVSPCTIRRPS